MSTVRVLIVHGHQLFADALALRLGSEQGFVVTGTAPTLEAAIQQQQQRPADVFVVALSLGRHEGEEPIRELRKRFPDIGIVAVAEPDTAAAAIRATRAGARGFVSMSSSANQLVTAVRAVSRREAHIPPLLLADVLDVLQSGGHALNEWEQLVAHLTTREVEILRLMVAGKRPNAIAEELYLSVNTVRSHLKKILSKLGVHSSVEAVSVAVKAGIRYDARDRDDVSGRP